MDPVGCTAIVNDTVVEKTKATGGNTTIYFYKTRQVLS